MKKNLIKLAAFAFLAFCVSFSLNAQESKRSDRAKSSIEKDKTVDRAERMEARLNKQADRLEMDAAQRAKYIPAQMEFMKEMRAIRKGTLEPTERKARAQELKTTHKNYLGSFLNAEQMGQIEKRHKRKKGKGKKGNGKKFKGQREIQQG